jgi:hypothetical protein
VMKYLLVPREQARISAPSVAAVVEKRGNHAKTAVAQASSQKALASGHRCRGG